MFEEQAITDKGEIMILHPVIENLQKLRLKGFVEALKIQMASSEASNLRFEERLSLLIEHEMNSRENRKLQNRLKRAKFKDQACLQDLIYDSSRKS